VLGIRRLTATGEAGTGGRSSGLVRVAFIVPDGLIKTLFEGTLLLKNLHESRRMSERCEEICHEFEC